MNFFNRLLLGEKMPDEWRSMLVPLYKGKGDIKECRNYWGIKLMSHTMKLWEMVIEARIRKEVTIAEQQFGFMPGRSTTDALFCLKSGLKGRRQCTVPLLTWRRHMTGYPERNCGNACS